MRTDQIDNETDNEGTNGVIEECLALLKECLSMLADRQRAAQEREEIYREESALREEQYPGDEYAMLFYDDDFKFEWL